MNINSVKFENIIEQFKKYSIEYKSNITNDQKFLKISTIINAKKDDLTFFSNPKYSNELQSTKAKACLIKKQYAKLLPNTCFFIIVENPYYSLACISELFTKNKYFSNGLISEYARINSESQIFRIN